MPALQQFITDNWLAIVIISVALAILIVLLWRNYDLDEITPTPPFIKFKRKTKPVASISTQPASVNVSGNKLWGKNKIAIRREGTNVSENVMAGENEIEVGAKPGPKAKKGKSRK